MNKKAAASLGVLGTGSAATATTLATRGTDVEESIDDVLQPISLSNDNSTQLTVTGETNSQKRSSLEDEVNNFGKIQKTNAENLSFDGASELSTFTTSNGYLNEESSLFGAYNDGKGNGTKSFLQIEVDRQPYKNGKWRGTLTWSGSFFSEDKKGFVTINQATTANDKKELVLTGGFYVIHKENGSGKVKYRKEIKKDDSTKKILNKSNFDKYFPKPYWYSKQGGFYKYGYSNGGFISGADDLDKICLTNDSECKDENKINAAGNKLDFEGSGGTGYDSKCTSWINSSWCDYVGNGSGDINSRSSMQGYDYMYGQIDNHFSLMDHLSPFYRGFGKKVNVPAKAS